MERLEKNNLRHGRRRGSVLTAALVSAAVLSLLITGCSAPKFLNRKPTAVSLAKEALDNAQKVQSAEIFVEVTPEIAVTLDSMNLSMNVDLDVNMDMEMTRDPKLMKGTVKVLGTAMGQNQEVDGEFYVDASGDSADTTYMRWAEGKWSKKTGVKGSSEESAQSPQESITQTIGIVKMIADEAMTSELKEEKVTVREKEAWQINTTLSGPLLKELLLKSDSGSDLIDKVNWDEVEIAAELYIYDESRLPARIVMDCKDIGAALLADSIKQVEDFPLGSVSMKVNECMVDLTLDRYDEIEPISIPQEALDAPETDSLAPGVSDVFGGMF